MTSKRHKLAMERIKHHSHGLTKRQRVKVGLPAKAIPKVFDRVLPPDDPSCFEWYVLQTLPQQEEAAARALVREGFAAFNPVEMVQVKSGCRQKHKRRVMPRPFLTSMVLVGFELGCASWLRVLGINQVVDVIKFGDVPAVMPFANMMALVIIDGCRGASRKWMPMEGDCVEVRTGAWAGRLGEVKKLKDGIAKIELLKGETDQIKLAGLLEVPEHNLSEVLAA